MSDEWWGLSQQDLTCPLCKDIFRSPVILNCSHTFCEPCVRTAWRHIGLRSCPECQFGVEFWVDKAPCNLALKNICEAVWQERDRRAEQSPKEKLKRTLETLNKKRKVFDQVQLTCEESSEHIKTQALSVETQIKAEFRRLRKFLKSEEASRMTALRREQRTKRRAMEEKMERLGEERSALSDTIAAAEEQLQHQDPASMQNFEATMEQASAQSALPDPQPVPGALLDEPKHLGNLSFHVWDHMKEMVKYTPVVLDPNTPVGCLLLSRDLTAVRDRQRVDVPDNPERFEDFWVLGSEGFSSGTHRWEVEVPLDRWWVGVAPGSVSRFHPAGGSWAVHYSESEEYLVCCPGQEPVRLPVNNINRLRVRLDMDRGQLSFSDERDIYIYTVTHTFTGKVFPIFSSLSLMSVLSVAAPVTVEPRQRCACPRGACQCFDGRDLVIL